MRAYTDVLAACFSETSGDPSQPLRYAREHENQSRSTPRDRPPATLRAVATAHARGSRTRRAGPRRSAGAHSRGGTLPFRPVGDRRQPAASAADGPRARGGGCRRAGRRRRDEPRTWRPRRRGVRAELRPLRALCREPAGALRAGLRGQQCRHAAVRIEAAARRARRRASPPRRVGIRGSRGACRELAGARARQTCRSPRPRFSAARSSPASAPW